MAHQEQAIDQLLINEQSFTPESSPLDTTKVNLFFERQDYFLIEARMDDCHEVVSAEN